MDADGSRCRQFSNDERMRNMLDCKSFLRVYVRVPCLVSRTL